MIEVKHNIIIELEEMEKEKIFEMSKEEFVKVLFKLEQATIAIVKYKNRLNKYRNEDIEKNEKAKSDFFKELREDIENDDCKS